MRGKSESRGTRVNEGNAMPLPSKVTPATDAGRATGHPTTDMHAKRLAVASNHGPEGPHVTSGKSARVKGGMYHQGGRAKGAYTIDPKGHALP